MWGLRILSGQQAGRVFPLKMGKNILGRAPSCDIKILSPGVSKEHACLDISADKIVLQDMESRNGTFVNGRKISAHTLRPGEQVTLKDVVFEVIPVASLHQMPQMGRLPGHVGNAAYQMQPMAPMPDVAAIAHSAPPQGLAAFAHFARQYIDTVVMPGVYHLAEIIEFRWLLTLFMGAFILLVTSLSTIPLIQILRESVEEQSQQHALTIANTLARVNEAPIRDGLYTAINMATAQRVGVREALIITAMDGKIIAPASRAEGYPKIEFVHEARRNSKEAVRQIDGTTVVALYPVEAYNPETGSRGVIAFSVVVYDMASIAVDDGKTLSLFIVTLFIALILGAILFFFVYKLIEYPLTSLNLQLDTALKEGRDDLKLNFQFQPLIRLTSNINSALSRILTGGGGASESPRSIEHDRRLEMTNLAEMVGFAAMVVSAHDRNVVAVNQGFEEKTGLGPAQIVNQSISLITDQALKLSLQDLLERLEQNPDQLATNDLEFSGDKYQLIAQAIYGTSKIAYFLVIVVPGGEG